MSEKGSSSSCPVSPAVGTVSGGVGHPLLAGPGPSCPLRNSEPEPSQLPHPTQRLPLSRDRLVSSIPKTEAHTPQHQPVDAPNWTYPSEQMFYNALKRKGYDARDEDIPAVVAIHNAVNERAWAKVKSWEAMHEE